MAITFEELGGGELAEKFQLTLAKIGENMRDPNMDPEAARGMTINITFKPSKSGTIDFKCDVKPKLAGFRQMETVLLIGQDSRTGRIEMSEYGSRPQVVNYNPVPVQHYSEPEPMHNAPFDPETGEIYQQQKGPIDLRNQ